MDRNAHADVAIFAGSQSVYIDVVVTNPSTATYMNQPPGGPAEEAAKEKKASYSHDYGPNITDNLVPFAMEATGRYGKDATKFIETFSKKFPDFTIPDSQLQRVRHTLVQRISIIIASSYFALLNSHRAQVVVRPTSRGSQDSAG